MPRNEDKTRSVITVDNERNSLPYSVFLTPGTYTLNADGSITISGGGGGGDFNLGAPLVAATLPDATTADWNPGDISTTPVIQVDTAGASAAVGGLVGGAAGYARIIVVTGANPLTLLDDASGAAGNRFFLNGDKLIPGGSAFMVLWNATLNGWAGVGA